MEKKELSSLVTLESKPDLSNKPTFKINFTGVKAKVVEEKFEDEDEPVRTVVKIVNKRKGAEYRENIFNRLALHNIHTGYADVAPELKLLKPRVVLEEEEKASDEGPKKTGKKLIIREVQFQLPTKSKVSETAEDLDSEDEGKSEGEDEGKSDDDGEDEEEGLKRLIQATEAEAVIVEEEKDKLEKPKRGRKPKKANKANVDEPDLPVDLTTAIINTVKVTDRLPKEREKRI